MNEEQSLKAYASFFETLSPESLAKLRELVTEDVYFKDPFNEHHGLEPMYRVLEKMFKDLKDPSFEVLDLIAAEKRGYIKWKFSAQIPSRWLPLKINTIGLSEVGINSDGKIARHVDYWDPVPAIYEQIPLLGLILRKLSAKIAAH